jgi:hypothetical protein
LNKTLFSGFHLYEALVGEAGKSKWSNVKMVKRQNFIAPGRGAGGRGGRGAGRPTSPADPAACPPPAPTTPEQIGEFGVLFFGGWDFIDFGVVVFW